MRLASFNSIPFNYILTDVVKAVWVKQLVHSVLEFDDCEWSTFNKDLNQSGDLSDIFNDW